MMFPSVTILIPCHNEAKSVASVVNEYRLALPGAGILVVDNSSTDSTCEAAAACGVGVICEPRRGKARAIITALEQIDSDLLIMVDGDGSYPAEGARILFEHYCTQPADMITGIRFTEAGNGEIFRPLHQVGTSLFGRVLDLVFGFRSGDIFSGLRLFSKRFYQNVPILSRGFELELELTVQAIDKGFLIAETPVPFRARTAGTNSKLRTVRDGVRIARFLLVLFRDYRPLVFFGTAASLIALSGLAAGILPVLEYFRTGLVGRFPLAVLAASLMILACLALQTGLSLESSLRYHREVYQNRIRSFMREMRARSRSRFVA
jgi:glycosyltransferase involved in cell wall biosynthesis